MKKIIFLSIFIILLIIVILLNNTPKIGAFSAVGQAVNTREILSFCNKPSIQSNSPIIVGDNLGHKINVKNSCLTSPNSFGEYSNSGPFLVKWDCFKNFLTYRIIKCDCKKGMCIN